MFTLGAFVLLAVTATPLLFAASCKPVAGIYPLGTRVENFYAYKHFAGILPPVVHRAARSYECGDEKGTLYILEFASDADRDQAEIFAKTMVDHDLGRRDPDSIREIQKGFIIVSFRNLSPELMEGLRVPASEEISAPVGDHEVPQVSTAVTSASLPLIEANEALINGATPAPEEPGLAAGPSTQNHLSAPPPTTPTSKPVYAVRPVKKKRPSPARKPKATVKPTAAPAAIPVAKTIDFDASALAYFADHMHCGFASKPEIRAACRWLGGFASGTPPDWPLKPGFLWVGKTLIIDFNGHLQSKHYSILTGVQDPSKAGFLSDTPVNTTEASELNSLIVSLEKHEAQPPTLLVHNLLEIASHSTVSATPTFGPSYRFSENGQMFYMRRADDHWVLVAVISASSDPQAHPTLIVTALYP